MKDFEYEVIYDNEILISSFKNLEKAMKYVKRVVKNNPDCKGKYDIRLYNTTIWNY